MMVMLKTTNDHNESIHFTHNYTINGHSGSVYSLTVGPTHFYSSSGDRFITRWDKHSGIQDEFVIKLDLPSYAIKYIEHNGVLVVGISNGTLYFFDTVSRKELKCFTQHKSAIFSIEQNKDNNHLYVGDEDGYLSIWNTLTWELEMIVNLNCGKIRSLYYSSHKKMLFIGKQNGEISIFETGFYNEIKCFRAHKNGVSSILYCEKRDLIASGGNDAHIRIWNIKGKPLKAIPAHNYTIYSLLRLSNDLFLSASRDKSIKVWHGFYDQVIQKIDAKDKGHNFSVNTLVKLNEKEFLSGSDDKKIICFKRSID
jgi:WD40 repeat protein